MPEQRLSRLEGEVHDLTATVRDLTAMAATRLALSHARFSASPPELLDRRIEILRIE
jgi:hypothetical protein